MHWPCGQKVKDQDHAVWKPSLHTVTSDYSGRSVTLCCATCGHCRRGSACRYDCLCFLVFNDIFSIHLSMHAVDIHGNLSPVTAAVVFVWPLDPHESALQIAARSVEPFLHTLQQRLPMLSFNRAVIPKVDPFLGVLSHLIHGSLCLPEYSHKHHLGRFSNFCRAHHPCAPHTHRRCYVRHLSH